MRKGEVGIVPKVLRVATGAACDLLNGLVLVCILDPLHRQVRKVGKMAITYLILMGC